MNLQVIVEPPGTHRAGDAGRGWPLLRLGFRPFYLGAAAYAAVAVPLWVAVAGGQATWPGSLPPMLWHAHEMLFGFAAAVIVGFLLTAGKAWTGLQTPRGAALGALVLLWLAARLAVPLAPAGVAAALDLPLLPAVCVVLGRVLLSAGNRRNLPLLGVMALLSCANAAFHAAVAGWLDVPPLQALHAALACVVMIECVMAGRVVPGFTMSATPGLRLGTPRWLSGTTLAATGAGLAGWVVAPGAAGTGVALALAALLHAALLVSWQPWRTASRPILWILHAAYAWLPVGLGLLAAAAWQLLAVSAGVHALGAGATAALIIGMITRTARGHTGRALRVGRAEVAAYGCVLAAGLLRVVLPLLLPGPSSWRIAALAWSAGFLLYLAVYGPWLVQPRVDGRDG